MIRPRLNVRGAALLLALGAFTLSVSPSLAQQPAASQQFSMLTIALLYTEAEAVDDELKLSEEQVQKLSEHRTKWFNDYWNLPSGRGRGRGSVPRQAGELSKANDKALAEILKPQQLKRLRELALQAVEKQYGGRALRYPEVAEELKLSEEQMSRARIGAPEAVLSKEQQAKWQAMKGDAFKGTLQPHVPARPNLFGTLQATPAALRTVRYLFSKSVQVELNLTDEQRTQVRALRALWRTVAGGGGFGAVNGDRRERTAKEIERAVGALLKPEQKARLEQIALQQELRLRPDHAVFTLPEVVGTLKLSAEQQRKIAALRGERQKAYRDLFLTGESSDEIAKKAEAFRKETYALLAKELSEEQRAGLKGVVGEPFKGPIVSIDYMRQRLPLLPTRSVSLVIAGLPFVEDKALHNELKLSDEQVKKLAEEHQKYLQNPQAIFQNGTEKAVGDILSADQLKRFKQLALQQDSARGLSAYTITAYKEVVDGLKLTDTQKEELSDGEPPDTVLTGDQQAKWKEMLGEPFQGTLTRSPSASVPRLRFPAFVPLHPAVRYLEEPSVQDDLKLSDAQRQKIKELRPRWEEATGGPPRGFGGRAPAEEIQAKVAEAIKAINKAVSDLLKPEQERRLRQIILQQRGGTGAILAADGVADELSLTADQRQQVKAIKENDATVGMLIINDKWLSERPGGSARFGSSPIQMALTRVTDERLAGVLTETQKAKLKELLGEPFKGELRTSGAFGRGAFPGLPSFAPPSFAPPP
jgi:hypothetical protein